MAKLKNKEVEENNNEIVKENNKESNIGILVSRCNHPETVKYKGEEMVIPPKGKLKNVDKADLGKLPVSVKFIPNTK